MKCLTIGGAMVDTIAIVDSERIERMVLGNADTAFLLLEEGRKTEAEQVSTHCGGGAVNAAVCMARLGLDVSACIKLGRDQRAESILAGLMQEGVSARWVERTQDAPTGASVMISSHDRNAAIFTFRGANTLLAEDDLRDDAFAVDMVYIAGLSNESAACFSSIVERADAHGASIFSNPGIRQLSARTDEVFDCFAQMDVLLLNRSEADALVPRLVGRYGEGSSSLPLQESETPPDLVARGLVGGGFEMGLAAFCSALLSLGPSCVLITDGGRGAFAATHGQLMHCPVYPSRIMGTAGAGDAFGATFAALRLSGLDVPQALQSAAINAASVVDHVDTQTGLLARKQIEERRSSAPDGFALRLWDLPLV